MRFATPLLTTLLLLAAGVTAGLKLAGQPEVIETLARVEVTGEAVVMVGLIELLGAAGLVIGWVSRSRLAATAAAGLALFFVSAVGAHLRVGDTDVAAPLALAGLAVTVAWLHHKRTDAPRTADASLATRA